jgi:cytochrome c-type biogenesis protein CcmH
VLERRWAPALALALLLGSAGAQEAPSSVADPVLEARVLRIAEELRCLVCQNETIAASSADLAVDLRKQIRSQLGQGKSEREILDFMVQRYGDFVLYRPPLKTTTLLLWAGPFALLALGLAVLVRTLIGRRKPAPGGAPSEVQLQRARRLLDGEASER